MERKNKSSFRLWAAVLFFYVLSPFSVFISSVHAEDDDDEGGIIGWIMGLIRAIEELIENIKRIASGEAIKEFFLNWVADWMQEFLNMWLKVLGFAFVKIPSFVQEGNWIHNSWGTIVWCTVPFLLLGILMSAYRIMKGIDVARSKSLLWVLAISMMFSFYSLTLFDYAIKLCNYFLSESMADTFAKLNQYVSKVKSTELQGFAISFDNMSGAQAVYLILIGPDGQQSLMRQLLAICGLWFSQFQGLVLFLLSFSTLLMYFVLICMAIFSPLWSSWSALSGRAEPMIGWGNLIVRCFAVKFLYSFAWRWMAERQLNKQENDVILDVVTAPTLHTLVIVVLLILTWFIFWKPVFRAAAQPLYLNGASVIEGFSKTTGRISKGLKSVASSFGVPISKENEDTFSRVVNKLDHWTESNSERAEKWKEKGEKLQTRKDDSFWEKIAGKSLVSSPALSYTKRKEQQAISFQEQIEEVEAETHEGVKLSGEYRVFQSQQNIEEIETKIQQYNAQVNNDIQKKKEAIENMKKQLEEIKEKQRLAQEEMQAVIESMKKEMDASVMQSRVAHRDYLTKQLNEWYQEARSLQENIQKSEKNLHAGSFIPYKKEHGQLFVFVEKENENQAREVRELFEKSLDEKRTRYWKHAGGGYVIIQDGVAMKTNTKPTDGVEMGLWKG